MFNPTLLRTFLAVAETSHFTLAARRLGLSQPTVSQHVTRLESLTGCALLARDTHAVTLTSDGEAMVLFARDILDAQDRAASYFADGKPRGRLRFGVSEDLALSRLPTILRRFVDANPQVDLDLSVGLSSFLYEQFDSGRLDLIFTKRRPHDERGQVVWQERLVWMGNPQTVLPVDEPVPLALYRSPTSITRVMAVGALQRHHRPWRTACVSDSLNGICAAVQAGLGVMVQSRIVLRGDLVEIPAEQGLPPLEPVDFVVLGHSRNPRSPAAALTTEIMENSRLLHEAAAHPAP